MVAGDAPNSRKIPPNVELRASWRKTNNYKVKEKSCMLNTGQGKGEK